MFIFCSGYIKKHVALAAMKIGSRRLLSKLKESYNDITTDGIANITMSNKIQEGKDCQRKRVWEWRQRAGLQFEFILKQHDTIRIQLELV